MYTSTLRDIPSVSDVLKKFGEDMDIHEDFLKFILKEEISLLQSKIKKKNYIKLVNIS